jgi:hypothetical protein
LSDQRFVVDGEDRVVQVAEENRDTVGRYLGHPLWTYLPGAEPVLKPHLDEARESGEPVESIVFYAGGTFEVLVEPSGMSLAVRLTRRTELNVKTLATLVESLQTIEAELAARAPARRDRPARESRQAPP